MNVAVNRSDLSATLAAHRVSGPEITAKTWKLRMNPQQAGEFFVGWGTLSLINAGLAQAKGRSGLNWWFLSLFIGPIATLLIVVMDRPESTPQS
jgi:hypothetical protein